MRYTLRILMKKNKKSNKPATQKDIKNLGSQIVELRKVTQKDIKNLEKKVEESRQSTKKDMQLLEKKLDSKVDQLRKDTQEDLELMGGNLTCQIDEVKEDLEESRQENNERMDKQDRILESLLVVTQTLSGQLAPIKESQI